VKLDSLVKVKMSREANLQPLQQLCLKAVAQNLDFFFHNGPRQHNFSLWVDPFDMLRKR